MLTKIQNKLSFGKIKILLRAGRLTLIKSVLNSLPINYMSMFKMPKAIAQKTVKMQRRFFWGDAVGERTTIPAIKWSKIELPKNLGGLGVANFMHKNLLLLFKWWWRFPEVDCTL